MKGKPVIVVVNLSNPMIFSEFEKEVNAIVANFGVQNQAILDILTGVAEPSGLLPYQMPADMKTVEEQNEDIPHDMVCYTDGAGNVYDFGFGLNWKGVINDARTKKYVRIPKPVIAVKGNTVTLTNTIKGASIYYTVDGSTPAFVENQLYTKPFSIKKGDVVKAIAKKNDVDNSSLVVYNYDGK